jgi:hypothetical protein
VLEDYQAHYRFSRGPLSTAAFALGMALSQRFKEDRNELLILQDAVACIIHSSERPLTSSSINPSPKVRCSRRILITAIPSRPF